MKETLAYDLLTVMQEKKQKRLTAKWRQWEFSVQYYDYEWVHKRVCDLVTNWCAMRAWATDDWILLYKVSEKWLCIKSFEDYKKATYKPRTPKPKKTREESAVKKESRVSWPSEKEMREMFTSLCNKYEKDWISKEDIAVRFWVPLSYNGIISTCIKEMIDKDTPIWWDKHSPRSPPVWYTAWTQITTTHRNEEWDIVIWYSTNSPDLGESTEIWHWESMSGEYLNHSIVWKIKCKMPCMLLATACDTCKEAFKGLLPPKQPRYKRLRSAFTGK